MYTFRLIIIIIITYLLTYLFTYSGTPTLTERSALHVVVTRNHRKSSSPRSADSEVDRVYAVLASADLAVILAVSLGAVLVAIAVIIALVFLASRRRRLASHFQRPPLKDVSISEI